ncbi:MAG TPA: methyltransferase domain-containing protein [bacterium]|nr:methyltransferase domain-containing protein [bacterium]
MQTFRNNFFFSEKFLDHFCNPRNVGELSVADGYARVGDPSCGDFIEVWIKVRDDFIIDYKYKVFGCGGAIATTSMASELAIGKRLKDAIKLTDDDIIRELGGIPENKAHCSLLGINGLRTAIADYLIRDNHRKYQERIEIYRRAGYDIAKHREQLVDFVIDQPNAANILDIGTGKGHLALAIARRGLNCISIDPSAEELYYARLNAIHYQLDERIEFKQMDGRQMEFPDQSFDAVICADMIHHLSQPDTVLAEMLRVCNSNGIIAVADLNAKGQKIVAQVLKAEGKNHSILGWDFKQIQQWFVVAGTKVQLQQKPCEYFLIAKKA